MILLIMLSGCQVPLLDLTTEHRWDEMDRQIWLEASESEAQSNGDRLGVEDREASEIRMRPTVSSKTSASLKRPSTPTEAAAEFSAIEFENPHGIPLPPPLHRKPDVSATGTETSDNDEGASNWAEKFIAPEPDKYAKKIASLSNFQGLGEIGGMCPVQLRRTGDLVEVNPDIQIESKSRKWHFCCEECQHKFAENPELYQPAYEGLDLVDLFLGNKESKGELKYGIWYLGRLFLFSSDHNRQTAQRNTSILVTTQALVSQQKSKVKQSSVEQSSNDTKIIHAAATPETDSPSPKLVDPVSVEASGIQTASAVDSSSEQVNENQGQPADTTDELHKDDIEQKNDPPLMILPSALGEVDDAVDMEDDRSVPEPEFLPESLTEESTQHVIDSGTVSPENALPEDSVTQVVTVDNTITEESVPEEHPLETAAPEEESEEIIQTDPVSVNKTPMPSRQVEAPVKLTALQLIGKLEVPPPAPENIIPEAAVEPLPVEDSTSDEPPVSDEIPVSEETILILPPVQHPPNSRMDVVHSPVQVLPVAPPSPSMAYPMIQAPRAVPFRNYPTMVPPHRVAIGTSLQSAPTSVRRYKSNSSRPTKGSSLAGKGESVLLPQGLILPTGQRLPAGMVQADGRWVPTAQRVSNGRRLLVRVSICNKLSRDREHVKLTVALPPGVKVIAARGPSKCLRSETKLEFSAIPRMIPGETETVEILFRSDSSSLGDMKVDISERRKPLFISQRKSWEIDVERVADMEVQ